MMETLTLWFAQEEVAFLAHETSWVTVKGPFLSEGKAEDWLVRKHGSWGSYYNRERFRVVRVSLPFEAVAS